MPHRKPVNRPPITLAEDSVNKVLEQLNLLLSEAHTDKNIKEQSQYETRLKMWQERDKSAAPGGPGYLAKPPLPTISEGETHSKTTAQSLIEEIVYDIRDILIARGGYEKPAIGYQTSEEQITRDVLKNLPDYLDMTFSPPVMFEELDTPLTEIQQITRIVLDQKGREIKAMPDVPTKAHKITKIVNVMSDEGLLTEEQRLQLLNINRMPGSEPEAVRFLDDLEEAEPRITQIIRPQSGVQGNFSRELSRAIESGDYPDLLPWFGTTPEDRQIQQYQDSYLNALTTVDEVDDEIRRNAIKQHLTTKFKDINKFNKNQWENPHYGQSVVKHLDITDGNVEAAFKKLRDSRPGASAEDLAEERARIIDAETEDFNLNVIQTTDELELAEQKKDPGDVKLNTFLSNPSGEQDVAPGEGYTKKDFSTEFWDYLQFLRASKGVNSFYNKFSEEGDFLAVEKKKKINSDLATASDDDFTSAVERELQEFGVAGVGDTSYWDHFRANIMPQIEPLIRAEILRTADATNPGEMFDLAEYTGYLLGAPGYRDVETELPEDDPVRKAIEEERAGQFLPPWLRGPVTAEQFQTQMDPSTTPAPSQRVQAAIAGTGAPFPGFPTGGQIYRPPPTELGFAERPELAEAIAGLSGGDTDLQSSIIEALPGLYAEFPEYAEEQRRQQRRDLEERLMGLGTRGIMEKPEPEGKPEVSYKQLPVDEMGRPIIGQDEMGRPLDPVEFLTGERPLESVPEPEPPPGVEVDKLGRWRTPAAMGIEGIRGFARQKTSALPTKFDFLPFLESRIPGIRREYEASPGYLAEQQREQQLADQLEIERQEDLEKEQRQLQQRSLRRGRTRIR